jgi:ATP-binding cassette, subfamily B, bacterial
VTLEALVWPLSDVPRAITALARQSRLEVRSAGAAPPMPKGDTPVHEWVVGAARWHGVDAVRVHGVYPDLPWILSNLDSILLRLPGSGEARFLAIARARGGRCLVLGSDDEAHDVAREDVVRALSASPAPTGSSLDDVVADLPARLRPRIREALVRDRDASTSLTGCWTVRAPVSSSFFGQLRRAHVPMRLAWLFLGYLAHYGCWVMSWWVLGSTALAGRADPGWLAAWTLLLLSMVPLRAFVSRAQGTISIDVGALLKQRLLAGALRMSPDAVRHQGVGQLLGRVIESEAIESLSLTGGFMALFAVAELLVSGAVLAGGAAGGWHAALLAGWTMAIASLAWIYFRRRRAWTASRMGLTNDLVERLVGYRTRLAQQDPAAWHVDEDDAVRDTLERSQRVDTTEVLLRTVATRGWLLAGIAMLVPVFVAGTDATAMAVGLGGVLLAFQALRKLVGGLAHVAGAAIAWESIRPLFDAASREEAPSSPHLIVKPTQVTDTPVLDARDLGYRYRPDGRAVLSACDLEVRAGERVLLEGASGSGKSTLAMVLAGIRQPHAGLLMLHGQDRGTLGADAWRRRVVFVPQFHENHLVTGTLAFNLLMGRRWPPSREDMKEADAVCRELGLADLLKTLPSGLLQMVGDTGWQLSHGERTRVFIARALLQEASVVIFDESFGALDPASLQQAVASAGRRAQTMIVIAHP